MSIVMLQNGRGQRDKSKIKIVHYQLTVLGVLPSQILCLIIVNVCSLLVASCFNLSSGRYCYCTHKAWRTLDSIRTGTLADIILSSGLYL